MDYKYKTEPYHHQHECFMLSRDKQLFAYLMEMGTGKSKILIDTAAWNYAKGRIDALIVAAPNGVHTNWVINEIEAHMPDWVPHESAYWRSGFKAKERKEWAKLWEPKFEGIRIFTFNIESLSTVKGKAELRKILNSFRVLLAIDEAHRIKTPGAARTKSAISLGRHAKMKRILTGTVITNNPLDTYSQIKFLSEKILGFSTSASFKAHFSVIERMKAYSPKRGEYEYDHVVAYRNVDEIIKAVAPYSYVARKKDCLDLPEKIYEIRHVDLTTQQKKMYDQLLLDGIAKITEGLGPGEEMAPEGLTPDEELWWYVNQSISGTTGLIKSENVLTTLLRLQQILGGWVTDDLGNIHELKSNRLNIMMETIEDSDGKIIIWARFKPELSNIAKSLRKKYGDESIVEYHGSVDRDGREIAVDRFQNDDKCRFFVGQPHSGGIGITLTAAENVIYYSNDFSYEARMQSEDRAHRIGQEKHVVYVDLVSPGTVDDKVAKALKEKHDMAEEFINKLEVEVKKTHNLYTDEELKNIEELDAKYKMFEGEIE